MRKILTVARREYRAMVATKAFLISILMMPVMMLGGAVLPTLMRNSGPKERTIAVVDRSGRLFDLVKQAAEARNQSLAATSTQSGNSGLGGDSSTTAWLFVPSELQELTDQDRYELSQQAREGRIYAFMEISDAVFDPPPHAEAPVAFYSQDAAVSDVRRWVSSVLSGIVRGERLREAGLDPQVVAAANAGVNVDAMGLLEKNTQGGVRPAAKADVLQTIFLPFGVMMLMFMVIMLSAQPMLDSVLEEKNERIAEVLLGSASPGQLMLGKLLGNVAGSLSVIALYLGGGYVFAVQNGWIDAIPASIIPYFVVYQVLAVLFFSSIFMAIGASVSQLKEAQSMLLPVWMMLMAPMFVWFNALRDPNGAIATAFSFFPPSAPMMMMLRLATGVQVPQWQVALSLTILIVSTIAIVWLAGRIFRVGILWKGKTPTLGEMLRWARD